MNLKIAFYCSSVLFLTYKCLGESFDSSEVTLIWTGVNVTEATYRIYTWKPSFVLDPPLRPEITLPMNSFLSNLKTLSYDCRRKRILVADWLSQVVGEVPLSVNENGVTYYYLDRGVASPFIIGGGLLSEGGITRRLHNLHFTEGLSVDWITGNIYYADFNSVFVINEEISYYFLIKDLPYRIKSIAVHPVARLLFYSTYGALQFSQLNQPETSSLGVFDLAGSNARQLLSYPAIREITGLTIDFHSDRLYFVDVSVSGTRLRSSDLNGTDLTDHYERSSAIFQQVAVFNSIAYVIGKESEEQSGSMWLVKLGGQGAKPIEVRRILHVEKPIAISLRVDYFRLFGNVSEARGIGSCIFSPPCEQLCLPRVKHERLCVCQVGEVVNSTLCEKEFVDASPPSKSSGSSDLILFIVLIPTLAMMAAGVWIIFQRKYSRLRGDATPERPQSMISHAERPYSVASYGGRPPSSSGRHSSIMSSNGGHHQFSPRASTVQETRFSE